MTKALDIPPFLYRLTAPPRIQMPRGSIGGHANNAILLVLIAVWPMMAQILSTNLFHVSNLLSGSNLKAYRTPVLLHRPQFCGLLWTFPQG